MKIHAGELKVTIPLLCANPKMVGQIVEYYVDRIREITGREYSQVEYDFWPKEVEVNL